MKQCGASPMALTRCTGSFPSDSTQHDWVLWVFLLTVGRNTQHISYSCVPPIDFE